MKVYLHGDVENGRAAPAMHVLFVAPAAFNPQRHDIPAHWVDHENKPLTFPVEFRDGQAEVEDSLGKYLIDTKQAHRTRGSLLRPLNPAMDMHY